MQTSFSRHFPATHPQRGNPTLFVEKVSKSFSLSALGEGDYEAMDYYNLNPTKPHPLISEFEKSLIPYWDDGINIRPKKHTIRSGKKCKVGDVFTPFVWSGKPYASPQIIFHHPIEIKRVVDFEMDALQRVFMDGSKEMADTNVLEQLAQNDGLCLSDFFDWFGTKGFSGQIRIWDDSNLLY